MSWVVDVALRLGALNLELAIEGGVKPVAIIGPNGSGKTTLLRTIAGAHPVTRGMIQIGGLAVLDSDRAVDLPPEERGVGYVPQGYGLFPHLSVLDNVAFGLVTRGAGGASSSREKAQALLEKMGSGHLSARRPKTLSGGEQQRVALARALMTEPDLLLLDEPLSALDAAARRSVRTYLASYLREHAKPTVVVTHDVRDVLALDAEVVVLDEGSVVQRGLHADVAKQPATDFVAEFFGAIPT
ncbi:MAG: ABC transporter ATP-binding protein [Myxococcota bacterium]|nr:ABC transporter ATP-binding protein [Myxococcota bacterium]